MKIRRIILLLIGTSMLISCRPKTTETKPDKTTYETTGTTNPQGTDEMDDFALPSEDPLLTLSNYEEYVDYLQTHVLPDEFITYDLLASIGAFEIFVCLTDARYDDYRQYMYNLIDDNGFELTLYIESCDRPVIDIEILEDIQTENLRSYPTESKGILMIDDLTFTYIDGRLLSVKWYYQNIRFILCGHMMLDEYPEPPEKNTFAAQMLSRTTTINTIESFNQLLDQKMHFQD